MGIDKLSKPFSMLSCCILCILLVHIASGCGCTGTPQPCEKSETHLTKNTVQQVFAAGKAYVDLDASVHSLTFECSILEGTACYFIDQEETRNWFGSESREIQDQIIHELGWKYVEHSRGTQGTPATMTIRCYKPAVADEQITCEVYRQKWEAVAVCP